MTQNAFSLFVRYDQVACTFAFINTEASVTLPFKLSLNVAVMSFRPQRVTDACITFYGSSTVLP